MTLEEMAAELGGWLRLPAASVAEDEYEFMTRALERWRDRDYAKITDPQDASIWIMPNEI